MPPKRKNKQPQKPPETADEYLAEAVFQEESAEKWRAGDVQKAARFYTRALNLYEEALNLFPSSFDLAYNRARIQYEITQRPALRAEFSSSLVQLLQTALVSNRAALNLAPEDADALFNTAQVLTSLGDNIDDDAASGPLLQEAVQLFQRCLTRQRTLITESEAQVQEAEKLLRESGDDDGGVLLDSSPQETEAATETQDSPTSSQWATIVAPVTYVSLIETCTALLSALSSLCTVITQGSDLPALQDLAAPLLEQQIPDYLANVQDQDIINELACEAAKFRAAFSDAQFRFSIIDLQQYDLRLKQIFDQKSNEPLWGDPNSPDFLWLHADALMAFVKSTASIKGKAVLRYTRLSKALEVLAEASKSPAAKHLDLIHDHRADAEMLRYALSNSGDLPENLSTDAVKTTLLANAATFYRGATAIMAKSRQDGPLDEAAREAMIKEAVVESIIGKNNSPLVQLNSAGIPEDAIRETLVQMVDELLITQTDLQQAQITL